MSYADAFTEYLLRQQGISKPAGRWEGKSIFDRYWISDELMPCCEGIQELHQHSLTAAHVAHLYGLPPAFADYARYRTTRMLDDVRTTRFAKLEPSEVIEIRQRAALGDSMRSIARDYPVSYNTIVCVVRRDSYQWAEDVI